MVESHAHSSQTDSRSDRFLGDTGPTEQQVYERTATIGARAKCNERGVLIGWGLNLSFNGLVMVDVRTCGEGGEGRAGEG